MIFQYAIYRKPVRFEAWIVEEPKEVMRSSQQIESMCTITLGALRIPILLTLKIHAASTTLISLIQQPIPSAAAALAEGRREAIGAEPDTQRRRGAPPVPCRALFPTHRDAVLAGPPRRR